jgi:sugar (pentulose or hexulose) kinase
MRVHLYSALGALKVGMDILLKQENVKLDCIFGHGGLFKTEGVGQRVMAASMNVPVSVMETAGEGGAWGIALLAQFAEKKEFGTLDKFLSEKVFAGMAIKTMQPDKSDVDGFNAFIDTYVKTLPAEKAAVEFMR